MSQSRLRCFCICSRSAPEPSTLRGDGLRRHSPEFRGRVGFFWRLQWRSWRDRPAWRRQRPRVCVRRSPAAVLAPLAVVAFVVRGLNRPVSWGHATAAIVLGSLFSTVVAILLEGAALAPIAIPIALGGGSADIYSPAVRFVLVLAAATVTAPLAEEFSKGLGMVLLRRRIGGASGAFVVGVSTGAGFAIVEDFGYYSLDPSFRSWSMFALGIYGVLG